MPIGRTGFDHTIPLINRLIQESKTKYRSNALSHDLRAPRSWVLGGSRMLRTILINPSAYLGRKYGAQYIVDASAAYMLCIFVYPPVSSSEVVLTLSFHPLSPILVLGPPAIYNTVSVSSSAIHLCTARLCTARQKSRTPTSWCRRGVESSIICWCYIPYSIAPGKRDRLKNPPSTWGTGLA
ncbi:hypothetical protein M430DRAFT_26694 [Amorphotheca resinae ATCC 22711]|uniref:Uncharacterized protein n=1 Tax=Amorphotheca resinae ATCC 22711 TaxID=857342 RepID=A0A2T3B5Z8_AMORE|nr:hypothetical protein M430DRAFT_26694 [Amorphotheca resinae ATCC 22711]PSS22184.1 hypothetical protein M430DRAFT_26694 [Amorphotheca resinae ATCC 22711]